MSKRITLIFTFLGLYLISAGISMALFSFVRGSGADEKLAENVNKSRGKIDSNLPKTEECPINGMKYTKPEREIWEKRRPITAIIENHSDARPQSGLSKADVVYEAVAEGGITRFLAVMYCGAAAEEVKLAPVRSARVYFINFAAEYSKNPIFLHVGGANNICGNCPGGVKTPGTVAKKVDAFKMMSDLGWRTAKGNDFDGGTNIGFPIVVRDQYRLGDKAAWEHSVVAFTDKIYDEAEKRGFGAKDATGKLWSDGFKAWKFADEKPVSAKYSEISFEFWSNKPDYNVSWKYDSSKNVYLRFNGGKPHMDHETNEQISAKNLAVIEVPEEGPVDKEGHMYYENVGTGKMLLFQNGDVIKGTWKKATQSSRMIFSDQNGKEISLVRGTIWVEAIPKGNAVDYK